jgi:hypothetical protein
MVGAMVRTDHGRSRTERPHAPNGYLAAVVAGPASSSSRPVSRW